MKIITYLLVSMISLLWILPIYALTFNLPADGETVVGQTWTERAQEHENLNDIAVRTGFGFYELVEANPHLSPHKVLPVGTDVTIPGEFVLPNLPRNGLVINLAELRLYYYPPDSNTVMTFPLAIGKEGWRTPVANTDITQKIKDPYWHVPDSIRAESARHGRILPTVVVPGPKNPLGKYALYLSIPGIRIHGTLAPHSIGTRGSHGCMRMYSEDIANLFNVITIGTPVHIVNQPNKIGFLNGNLYLESHLPLHDYDKKYLNIASIILSTPGINPSGIQINRQAVTEALSETTGIPQAVGQLNSLPIFQAEYSDGNFSIENN